MKARGIYYIQNIKNSKIYIGSAIDIKKRWREHKHHLYRRHHCNSHLQSVWNSEGEDIFIFGIMELVSDKYLLLDREQYWIDRFDSSNNKYGYNKAPIAGSTLGIRHSEEYKEKLRQVGFPKGHTPWNKGKKMTGEYLENFVEAMRSEKVREMRRNRTWSHHTDETKKKISEAGKGRKRSEETKQKMREVRMGKPMPKGHRENCIKAWEKRKLKK